MIPHKIRRLCAAALACAALIAPAAAFSVSPMVIELGPTGPGAERSIKVSNPDERPIAVESEIFARSQTLTDDTIAATPSPDFIVLPPQVVIPGKSTQVIRVRWVGTDAVDVERAFRLRVRAVPYERRPGDAGIDIAGAFLVSVYVTPKGAKSNLSVAGARIAGGKIEFDVANSGNKRATVIGGTFKFEAGGKRFEISREEAIKSMGTATILAGNTRKLKLNAPAGAPDGPIQLDWSPQYLVE